MDDDQPSAQQTVGAIAAALLEIVRTLGRIEERLGHLEGLLGANVDIEPDVAPAPYFTTGAVEAAEYGQSALRRTWDETAGRYRYEPEP